jgi:hypothetical protein
MPGSRPGHCFPPGALRALRALYTAAYSGAYGAWGGGGVHLSFFNRAIQGKWGEGGGY